METKNIEVMVGKEPETAPEGEAPKTSATLPQDDSDGGEVEGRAWVRRQMQCWNCYGVSWVDYDTNAYHAYTCCFCGATNVL